MPGPIDEDSLESEEVGSGMGDYGRSRLWNHQDAPNIPAGNPSMPVPPVQMPASPEVDPNPFRALRQPIAPRPGIGNQPPPPVWGNNPAMRGPGTPLPAAPAIVNDPKQTMAIPPAIIHPDTYAPVGAFPGASTEALLKTHKRIATATALHGMLSGKAGVSDAVDFAMGDHLDLNRTPFGKEVLGRHRAAIHTNNENTATIAKGQNPWGKPVQPT